jgi:serine/threonine protein kinase
MGVENLSGQTLGQYELRDVLGAGGMGIVYRAYQAALRREVAIKVLTVSLATQSGYLARFNREAQTSAALEHTHIVPIYDYGTTESISYIVMRLLTGGTLAQRLAHREEIGQPLPSLRETSMLLKALASALDYAHRQGVIHRDIKTSNVMLDSNGSPYLVDFGIARLSEVTSSLTGTSMMIGTPSYMSPEQWRSDPIGPPSDQYALGVLMYVTLTGKMPFEATTPYALMHKHINEAAVPVHEVRPDAPPAIDRVLQTAMAKNPEDRFPTAGGFAAAYERAVNDVTVNADDSATAFFTSPFKAAPLPMLGLTPSRPIPNTAPVGGIPVGTPASGTPALSNANTVTPGMGPVPAHTPVPAAAPSVYAAPPATAAPAQGRKIGLPVILAAVFAVVLVVGGALFALSSLPAPDDETPITQIAGAPTADVATATAPAAAATDAGGQSTPTASAQTPVSGDAASAALLAVVTAEATQPAPATADPAVATLRSGMAEAAQATDELVLTTNEAVPVTDEAASTPSPAPTTTPSDEPELLAVVTQEAAATRTPSPTPTDAPSETPLPTRTDVPTATPTDTPQPTNTPSETPLPTATATPAPTETPSHTFTPSLTHTPRATKTPFPSATPLPTSTTEPSATLTPTSTAEPAATLTPVPSATATPEPLNIVIDNISDIGDIEAEQVEIFNQGPPVSLEGWRLETSTGESYIFPAGRALATGGGIILSTREGRDTALFLFWNREAPAFSPGDVVTLFDQTGAVQFVYEALAALPTHTPTPTPTATENVETITYTGAQSLNVRTGDATSFPVLTTLARNTTVEIIGVSSRTSEWLLIELPDGRRGWVSRGPLGYGDTAALDRVTPPSAPAATTAPTRAATAVPTSGGTTGTGGTAPTAAPSTGYNCAGFTHQSPRDGIANGSTTFYWSQIPGLNDYWLSIFDDAGNLKLLSDANNQSSVTVNTSRTSFNDTVSLYLSWEVTAFDANGQVACTTGRLRILYAQ